MSLNVGVVPVNPETLVGQLRILLGDLEYDGLDEPIDGFGDYYNFSDQELAGFLIAGGGSVTRGSGYAYMRLAALAATNAISWRSDDLAVDSKIPPSEFRLLARIAFEQADAEDEGNSGNFDLIHPYSERHAVAELTLAPVCHCHGSCYGWC